MIDKFINTVVQGNALETTKKLPDKSVDCVITSPPYWQLRYYSGIPDYVWGGNENCEHDFTIKRKIKRGGKNVEGKPPLTGAGKQLDKTDLRGVGVESSFCNKCGAWKGQLGLEPTFQMYLEHLWQIMDEIWRVLKDEGTVWVNLGDSYAGAGGMGSQHDNKHKKGMVKIEQYSRNNVDGIRNKSLCLVPHRFAIGAVDRGWIVRNDIKWQKVNGMPESVTDRFSKKSEYFFFMVKQPKYYFDLDSIREPHKLSSIKRQERAVGYNHKWTNGASGQTSHNLHRPRPNAKGLRTALEAMDNGQALNKNGKNPGDVAEFWDGYEKPSLEEYLELCEEYYYSESDSWNIPTKPSKAKHYATYNPKLIDKPIAAGCPEGGVILDPFCGTGTTLVRAIQLDRKAIGIDGSAEYCEIAEKRINDELDNLKFAM